MTSAKSTYWPYIWSGFAALLALGFLDNIRGPFFPDMIRDLELTDSQGALFYSVPSFIMVFGSFIVPKLLRVLKPLMALRLGLLCMGLGFMYFGFIESVTDIIVGGVIFGIGFGIVNVMQNYMIQIGAEASLRQRLFSGLHSNYAAAAIAVPLIANFMKDMGWAKVYLILGSLPLWSLAATFFIKESAEHLPEQTKRDPLPKSILIQAIVVAICFAFYLNSELSLSTRMVHYLQTELGYEKTLANYHFLGFFIGMFISRIIIAKYQVSYSAYALVMISCLITGICYALGLFVNPWFFVATGFFIGPVFPFYLEYLSVKFEDQADRVLALMLSVSALGIVIMHTLVGYISDTASIRSAMLVGPIGLVFVLAILTFHHKKQWN